jgi:hypothetical protein
MQPPESSSKFPGGVGGVDVGNIGVGRGIIAGGGVPESVELQQQQAAKSKGKRQSAATAAASSKRKRKSDNKSAAAAAGAGKKHKSAIAAAAAEAARNRKNSKAPWRTHSGDGGKNSGKWTMTEREAFQKCYDKYGKDLQKFLPSIPTRTMKQIQSYYSMYKRHQLNGATAPAGKKSPAKKVTGKKAGSAAVGAAKKPGRGSAGSGVSFARAAAPSAADPNKNRKWNDSEREAFHRCYQKYGKVRQSVYISLATMCS